MKPLIVILAAALTGYAARLPVHVYRTSQGLPRNSVTCMAAGENGIMWFCSTEGLVRFDGYNFRVFGTDQGLPSHFIFSFARSRQGGYWLVTDHGLCRLPAGSKIGDPCRPIAGAGSAEWNRGLVVESPSGETWAANEQHVFRVSPDRKSMEDIRLPISPRNSVLTLCPDDGGRMLIGTEGGLFEWTPGGAVRSLTVALRDPGISSIVRHSGNDYWLATSSGLYRMRLDGPNRDPEFRGGWLRADELPVDLLVRRDGSLWTILGGVNASSVLQMSIDTAGDATVVSRMGPENGLPLAPLQQLTEDEGGRLWISTEGEGVVRIEDNGFVAYGENDGLGGARIASLFEDRSGRLCVMTTWDGKANLRVRKKGRFHDVAIPYPSDVRRNQRGGGWNQFGLQARNGEWWIPSDNGLLQYEAADTDSLPRARLKHAYRPGAGLSCTSVFRVFEDTGGNIWTACEDASPFVARLENSSGGFREFHEDAGWPHDVIASVFRQTAKGTLWIATSNGIVRFRGGRFETLPLYPPDSGVWVRDLWIDKSNRVWAATAGKGLFRCDDPEAEHPHFVNYTAREGLASLFLRGITEDLEGFLYVSSVRGVDRIDPRLPIETHHIRHFSADDGLPDNEHNVAFAGHDGHLWFGTLHGLAEYDPSRNGRKSGPGVFFTRVMVRGEEVPLDWEGARHASLSLAPDRNQVQVEFTGSHSGTLSALLYQYRLVGSQEQWSEPSSQLRVNYSALPYGDLSFEARAVDPDGQISAESAILDLAVAAPLWRRSWFLFLAALALAGAATFAYRYRVEQLLAVERLRTSIAVDLHDDIGANLSQIAILTEVARRDPARGSLEIISTIARETVEDMSDIVWAINPRHDRLNALLHRMRRYAEETLGGVDMELTFESGTLPADLTSPIEARRPLYLVFKEAINNAARHSRATVVTVRIEVDRGQLRMTIEDNGRGFFPSATHEGEGVASIGRRMRAVGGAARWDSAPGQGTRLVAILPIARSRTYIN